MAWRLALILAATGLARASPGPTYVGAAACSKCHAAVNHKWAQSRHSKMVQPAAACRRGGRLLARRRFSCAAITTSSANAQGAYYITESYLSGKPQEHRVDYTLGNRRMQHYLTTLPDGRIVVLPPTWDVLRKQWFHNLDIADPDETSEVQVQIWNKGCYSCHVSQEEKNYDAEKDAYQHRLARFRHQLRALPRPGERPRRQPLSRQVQALRRGPGYRRTDPPRPRAQHHGLRAVPFPPRHLRHRLHGRRELLRFLSARHRVQSAHRSRSRVLAGRPHPPLLKRRLRSVAERMFSQRRRHLRRLPHDAARSGYR